MTLCGERNDLEATLALLSSLGYDAVHLIGGSMGGAVVSTMDYTRLPMVQSLTLWFPVMDFGRMSADFFSPAHREEAMRTGAAEIHSLRNGTVYHLGRDLFEEVSGRQPEEYLQSVQLPVIRSSPGSNPATHARTARIPSSFWSKTERTVFLAHSVS